jgi:hypothetical protein
VAPETIPGESLIMKGIEDLSRGLETTEALLVSIGAPRLLRLGFPVRNAVAGPEKRLYELLERSGPDSAHSRYNALVRRLASFEQAAECVSP